jgi:transketolase
VTVSPPPADLHDAARRIRVNAVRIASARGQGYVGQALGVADILACLFFDSMSLSGAREHRDRFILSPGHYALGLYAVLAELGEYDFAELQTYGMDGSRIEESPLEGTPGFEVTGGSLAQGLSQAVGVALGKRLQRHGGRVFCLISDGELQEGQIWEAALSAAHRGLSNLVVLVDCNGRQVDGSTESVTRVEPVGDKFASFGFSVRHADGNDLDAVRGALRDESGAGERPRAVVCRTALGHPLPSFVNAEYPHYVRAAPEVWQSALVELLANGAA